MHKNAKYLQINKSHFKLSIATLLAVKEELIVPRKKRNSTVAQQRLQIYLECEEKGTLL